MKRTVIVLMGLIFAAGCSYKGEDLNTYLENPSQIIKDPHFSHYQEKRDSLESQYLSKEISYADYVKQLEELDDQYSKEVQDRTDIITGTSP